MADVVQTYRPPCANTENLINGAKSPCTKQAPNTCKGCFLVQYCSKECQIAHWSRHKLCCKSPMMKATWKPNWEVDGRIPAFVAMDDDPMMTIHGRQKYLWGNVPAIDMINRLRNEADNFPAKFCLLFAASGDIRNVVKTFASLPSTYTGYYENVINDRDFYVVARNIVLLLVALNFEPGIAASIMLHIWYSALIPAQTLRLLQERILPQIQEVCVKIKDRSPDSMQSKTWTFGTRSIRIVLRKRMWARLPTYLQLPDGMSPGQALNIMQLTTLAPERKDYLERSLYSRPPWWRMCTMKFREEGLLLPFGHSRFEFDTPNPTLFQSTLWPMMDSADPLEGWPAKDVAKKALPAKNDMYGNLFVYLQSVLLEFCNKLQTTKACFHLFNVDAVDLPGLMQQGRIGKFYFDRIEVSNICDCAYIGPQCTLDTFGPLLKAKDQNPHATLLMLFLNATEETCTEADLFATMEEKTQLRKYLTVNPAVFQDRNKYTAEFMRIFGALALFRDFDKPFNTFMEEQRFEEIGLVGGLKMKPRHTIIEPWPMRLKLNAPQEEFDALLASGHIGSERYVEWESIT